MSSPSPSSSYQKIATQKQAERLSRIPKEWLLPSSALPSKQTTNVLSIPQACGLLTPTEIFITTNHDAVSLAQCIRDHKYTALQVTIAFCKRAAIAQQLCNCLTEIFFNDAISRAQKLDEEFQRTGQTIGPLHGVPISLKDTFKLKGYDSSIGIASLAFHPAKENSLLVDLLLSQGAILYCKTNVPQTLMALDTDNFVFGRTLNPLDVRLTAGGSSGGEGALIAMRGSVLGVGTDVGGSIRIPAMCNGLYGFKPSSQRIPFIGQQGAGREGVDEVGLKPSAGPLATSLRDCELFLKSISGARPWERDPSLVFGRWEEQGNIGLKPLIGVLRRDGVVEPLPPIQKILEETIQKLRGSGIEVVEISAPAFSKCQSLANKFFGIDGGNHVFDLLEKTGEPLINWLKGKIKRGKMMELERLLEIQNLKGEIEKEMLKIWRDGKERRIDVIICPVAPHPTPPIDRWNGAGYTSSFVLLDYPAGVIPVRDLEGGDLEGEVEGRVIGNWDRVNRELWDRKTVDREMYLDSKLSIQVVAPKLQERRLYQAMSLIDKVLRKPQPSAQPKL